MASEKFIVASVDNPTQITIRNVLSPGGFVFLANCNDSITLLRQVRTYNPDFIVVDLGLQLRELKSTIETIDEDMLCTIILTGSHKDIELLELIEKSNAITFCPKPLNKDLFIHTVEMSIMSFRRVYKLNKKLKEVTESYETRKAVERAKLILMEREGISENDAYERMRKKSMDSRTSMKALAEAIIFAYEIGKSKK